MDTLIDSVRSILGHADFYVESTQSWDYALMIEYLICAVILLCVVCNVFALLRCFFGVKK